MFVLSDGSGFKRARNWNQRIRVNDLYKPIIHFKCLLGVYLFMNKHWLGLPDMKHVKQGAQPSLYL